jgi:cobalamin biosynthesis protein CobT
MVQHSNLDRFRHALAGATRAIAGDAEADVMFASEGGAPASAWRKRSRLLC